MVPKCLAKWVLTDVTDWDGNTVRGTHLGGRALDLFWHIEREGPMMELARLRLEGRLELNYKGPWLFSCSRQWLQWYRGTHGVDTVPATQNVYVPLASSSTEWDWKCSYFLLFTLGQQRHHDRHSINILAMKIKWDIICQVSRNVCSTKGSQKMVVVIPTGFPEKKDTVTPSVMFYDVYMWTSMGRASKWGKKLAHSAVVRDNIMVSIHLLLWSQHSSNAEESTVLQDPCYPSSMLFLPPQCGPLSTKMTARPPATVLKFQETRWRQGPTRRGRRPTPNV